MISGSFEIRNATREEMSQTVSTIVAAFITDPLARFAWPSPHEYLRAMPLATREFAGGSFEHGAACVSGDFCGAALWLPPGVHPNAEALERVFRETAKPEHLVVRQYLGGQQPNPRSERPGAQTARHGRVAMGAGRSTASC